MKSLGSILKGKTSSRPEIINGINSSRIVYLANIAIKEILDISNEEAKAVYVKNNSLTIECGSTVISQEVKINERFILEKIFKIMPNTQSLKVKYIIK
jgi:hypothetical protein